MEDLKRWTDNCVAGSASRNTTYAPHTDEGTLCTDTVVCKALA